MLVSYSHVLLPLVLNFSHLDIISSLFHLYFPLLSFRKNILILALFFLFLFAFLRHPPPWDFLTVPLLISVRYIVQRCTVCVFLSYFFCILELWYCSLISFLFLFLFPPIFLFPFDYYLLPYSLILLFSSSDYSFHPCFFPPDFAFSSSSSVPSSYPFRIIFISSCS